MPLKLSPTQLGFNARGDGRFNQGFAEQIAFFRQKLNLPTEYYDDIVKQAHDRAFVVAGAQKADLLTDLRQSVDKAIAEGKSIQWFRKEFDAIVKKRGWQGWTGSDSQAGRDWRTRIIYKTNLSASYAAGRWNQLNDPRLLQTRPYWKYIHNDTVTHPRPLHQSWSGLVLRHDDPWWQTHFPPNGWGCRCRVTAVRETEFIEGTQAPDDGLEPDTERPRGIDPGWDYAPGSSVDTSLRTMVQNKLISYPPAISSALSRDISRYVNAQDNVEVFAQRALADNKMNETLWLGFVENPASIAHITGVDATGYFVLLPSDVITHVVKSHGRDGKGQRPATAEDYQYIRRVLSEGDITLANDSKRGAKRILASLKINEERYRAVFEIRTGKKNRAVTLISLVIKTSK